MKASLLQVLNMLTKKMQRGVTWDDFPKGKHITKRISELRDMGYYISDQWEVLPSGCKRKRYFYLGKVKS